MQKTTFASVVSTFIVCFLLWMLLTWSLAVHELIAGAVVSLVVALFSARFFIHEKAFGFFNPVKLAVMMFYCLIIYPQELIKANWDVAMRALRPGKPNVAPGIVRIPINIHSDYGITALANAITLTPGTITMDIGEDDDGQRYFYVHWIDVKTTDDDEAADIIKGRLEKWLRRIWR